MKKLIMAVVAATMISPVMANEEGEIVALPDPVNPVVTVDTSGKQEAFEQSVRFDRGMPAYLNSDGGYNAGESANERLGRLKAEAADPTTGDQRLRNIIRAMKKELHLEHREYREGIIKHARRNLGN